MKRTLILLVALGLLIAFAAPAGAAKPDKPGKPEPELVEVTLIGDLDTVLCPETLIMEMDNRGNLFAGEGLEFDVEGVEVESVPRIFINAAIPWHRSLPAPVEGTRFEECHGGSVGGSMDWDGALWITPTAESIEILWLFDHYWEKVPKNPNKPDGPTTNLIENFVLMGEAFGPDGNGEYEGDFTIGLHGEEPFGTVTMAFAIEIVEAP